MGNFGFGSREKTIIILRGLPGSGKTTLANQLCKRRGVVYSTNDYFTNDNGDYKFRPYKLKEAHLWNQQRTAAAMEKGVNLIVINNINIRKWEAKPYVKMAIEH